MRNQYKRGFFGEGVIIIVGICIILLVLILPKKPGMITNVPSLMNNTPTPTSSTQDQTIQANNVVLNKNSVYTNSISIDTGNAVYSIQPDEEYITITNRGDKPIDITGWSLQNGKGYRTYALGGMAQKFNSDTATIPQAALYISTSNKNSLSDVVLKTGEVAIVTTGSIGLKSPYTIVSFKENECSGYLGSMSEYNNSFTPTLTQSCVPPRNELGVASLDTRCQDFIKGMQTCHTPKFNTVDSVGNTSDRQGNTCTGCVDGNPNLSNMCVSFIKEHYSYAGCLANHINDPYFSGNTWRIYLGKTWEMWAKNYEVVSLYDSAGNLVDYKSY